MASPPIQANCPDLVPRNYQEGLIRKCVKQNTIIYLPTGAGKTFIAVCALKEIVREDFEKSYSDGGKVSLFVVNTVALVQQHAICLEQNTLFKVGSYTGDMNVDYWDQKKWLIELNSHHVLVMTAQILKNIITTGFIDLNKVNTLIIDECHHGVEKHPMRETMLYFNDLVTPPRVIGLTATLLNGNVKPSQVLTQIENLEVTFHAKIAAMEAKFDVLGFSTNPLEKIITYKAPVDNEIVAAIIAEVTNLADKIQVMKKPSQNSDKTPYKNMKEEKPYDKYYKLLLDAGVHFKMLGIAGARIASIIYLIHLELDKRQCSDAGTLGIINVVISLMTKIRYRLEAKCISPNQPFHMLALATNKVQILIHLLQDYKKKSQQPLCGIIFVERKNTAIFLYHYLCEIAKEHKELDFIKPEFVIGYNSNPLNTTPESLYYAKMNKKIMEKFATKEINLLIASNVIEEGIDVQTCSLVIKFDTVKDYRSYIQSKGRARHVDSLYYIMVEDKEYSSFQTRYTKFQQIENILNEHLIGKYDSRQQPSDREIQAMYAAFPIFYANGIGSANVSGTSAVALLYRYCTAFKCDQYTVYEPTFYLECGNGGLVRVHIEMPMVCPHRDLISGDWKRTKREAKHWAACVACMKLYEIGELTNDLLPKAAQDNAPDTQYLFTHWPENGSKFDGVSKQRRPYSKIVSKYLSEPLKPHETVYLHIVDLQSSFTTDDPIMREMYENDLCFGLLSAVPLPDLCAFPLFVLAGRINVDLLVNQNTLQLDAEQIQDIKKFHHLIFADVLNILNEKAFVVMGNNNTQHLYVVPISKSNGTIDFDVIRNNRTIVDYSNIPTVDERINLKVSRETHLNKVVTPYYRPDKRHHLVVEVCENLTPSSEFPNQMFSTYIHYYRENYELQILNMHTPMLLVKALSSNANCLMPKGAAAKRKRDVAFETMTQHFIPELCIKQEFPSPLWVSASLLPSILHRIDFLLRAEKLGSAIANSAGLDVSVQKKEEIQIDYRLIKYNADDCHNKQQQRQKTNQPVSEDCVDNMSKLLSNSKINANLNELLEDMDYPWDHESEPKDCMRNLSYTHLELSIYTKFMTRNFTKNAKTGPIDPYQRRLPCLSINYEENYVYKDIDILHLHQNEIELRAIFESLCSAKAHDVVNLERLETLGDSLLKYAASAFIFQKFPTYTEGEATTLKGRIVSNRNLFYLANLHNIGGILNATEFTPKNEWLPPGYCVPPEIKTLIENNQMPINNLFNITIPFEEQLSGCIRPETLELHKDNFYEIEETDEAHSSYISMCDFMGVQMVGDKMLADVMEAIIGAFVNSVGIHGGIRIIEWFGIIKDNLSDIINEPVVSPIISNDSRNEHLDLRVLLSNIDATTIENILNYKFRNRAFLLQALSHSSYSSNKLTHSYQRLEFIGDAVLDLLITCYIYENNTTLNPGELTDLRSALVNNETFSAYIVKLGLHKYLKHFNSKLAGLITKFETYQRLRNHDITSGVLTLLNEGNLHLAENVDVPKVLGDLFESIAGAIYLDSGKNLSTVWRVYHKIMWREIEAFSKNVPKNPIRLLHESLAPNAPTFKNPRDIGGGTVMVEVEFKLEGTPQQVYGFGENKLNAKKAASKIALRLINSST